jgi:hypothetical protein
MTDQQNHPITPPPELVQQWVAESWHVQPRELRVAVSDIHIAAQAAKWGSDQQLEECCEQLKSIPSPLGIPFGVMASNALRAARRPKPPSLKEQALIELGDVYNRDKIDDVTYDTIRKALEALDD